MNIKLRRSQEQIIAYTGGKLGISAVPGSGKTFTLSALAATLIERGALETDQEVLVVTLVNSAVENFSARISGFIRELGLLPGVGYRVRTLHGLAHDIVREKPALAGLSDRFAIVDEREAELIRKDAVRAWLAQNPGALEGWLSAELDTGRREWVGRNQLPDLADSLALAFIRTAKDERLDPEALRLRLEGAPAALPLAEMGLAVYSDYQRALAYRGAVDFDDLIRLSLDLLERDPDFLERLRYRWPFILEDEAQDSSQLQENILRLLAGPGGNWVRVGDPNQAIFETFTTADPRHLRDFIQHEADRKVDLPESGRSQPAVIALANALIDWTRAGHPDADARDALAEPHIRPAPKGDPQPNPTDDPDGIRFVDRKYSPEEEIQAVADSLERWLPEHQDRSVAVLVPRNQRGAELAAELKKRGIDHLEHLSSTAPTRAAAGALGNLLAFLAEPASPARMARAYEVWRRAWRESDDEALQELRKQAHGLLKKCRAVEAFLHPVPGNDWLAGLDEDEAVLEELAAFREIARRWLGAALLPIDQLVLSLSPDLFTAPADLALAHKLALVLGQAQDDHPDWRLPELTAELGLIARNERRFLGFSSDDAGFDPNAHRGRVVITTMHKAKGLEWDRVYLMSVNNYDFPSNQSYDRYISEKWFIRSGLNLEAEALAQLRAALATGEFDWYEEGRATQAARIDYTRERLRLLYVGITRARMDLLVTWNSGRQGDARPALPLVALQEWWQNR